MDNVPVELHDVAVASWSTQDVLKWLKLTGFSEEVCSLFEMQAIDGYTLLRITEHDLRHPPVSIKQLGVIKHLTGTISTLKSTMIAKVDITKPGLPVVELPNASAVPDDGRRYSYIPIPPSHSPQLSRRIPPPEREIEDNFDSDSDDSEPPEPSPSASEMQNFNVFPPQHRRLPPLKPEIGKAMIAFGYFLSCTLLTAFVMVIVHDRVPDMEKYPPLPDFFLDNIPLIPWAFDMCEMAGFLLSLTWFLVCIFHKHRFILIRRFFALMGTIFFLRSVCMLITSLSVPGRHLKCSGKTFGDPTAKLQQALVIARGFGLSVQGVRTCGDYMFSGHTVVITVLNHFITEYTSKRLRLIHLSSWILNLFGMFFILAAHEHYSIDVFIAFYISSRLFLYYHTMANSEYLHRHPKRAVLYYPLYSFFESEVYRIVPNEYEWPFLSKWPYFKFHNQIDHKPASK